MVNQMRRRFFSQVVAPGAPAYSHVIVFGGVNDLYSDLTAGRTNDKIERDLMAMYRAARERGAQVVAITVTPWGGFSKYFNARRGRATRALNRWILDRAPGPLLEQAPGGPASPADKKQRGPARAVDYAIDGFSLLSCGDPDRLCDRYAAPFRDGLHFGPAGHQVLGEAVYKQALTDCL
jgi:lysophospholipase L1-like esterase